MTPLLLPMVCLVGMALARVSGFCPYPGSTAFGLAMRSSSSRSVLYSTPQDEDQPDGGEGAELASQLFRMAQKYGIGLGQEDLTDDDDDDEQEANDDDDDDDDEEEYNYPQGAINAFLGYDTGNVGEKLAGNVTLTDTQLYSEVKERVLDTAGGFVEMVRSANEDDDDTDDEYWEDKDKPKVYVPPVRVPDSELTAGEVVLLVLEALNNNDNPYPNRGVEILFGYSSAGSTIQEERKIGLTEQDYADFLKDSEYKVLFQHEKVSIDKGDYSFDGNKAFFTARLQVGENPLNVVPVNFILSSSAGSEEDSCWLVDSLLIRPSSMRRRRRK